MPWLPPERFVAPFSEHVLAADFPALPPARRAEVTAFVLRRVDGLPSPMRAGVSLVAVCVGLLGSLVGIGRVVAVLRRHPLPVAGEYVRLVRSLAYAYVWERWPDTAPDGAPGVCLDAANVVGVVR